MINDLIIKIMKILFALILSLMIMTGHNFAHAMTAELSWHVQNYAKIMILHTRAMCIFTRFGFSAHKC